MDSIIVGAALRLGFQNRPILPAIGNVLEIFKKRTVQFAFNTGPTP